MDDILKQISCVDYQEFRTMAMKQCGWTQQVFRNKRQGRTAITKLELDVLRKVAKRFAAK